MLNTLKATLSPSGNLTFEESVSIQRPVAVLVTLLEDPSTTATTPTESDPLAWRLSDEEKTVWDELPSFRARNPLRISSLEKSA